MSEETKELVSQEAKTELVNTAIRPCLNQVAEICKESDIDFITALDYGENTIEGIIALNKNPTPGMFLVAMVMQAEGEIDEFIKLLRDSIVDHNSLALSLLGFPRRAELRSVDPLLVQLSALHFHASSAGLNDAAAWLFNHMVSLSSE